MVVDVAPAAHHQTPVFASRDGLANKSAAVVDFRLQSRQRRRLPGGHFRRLQDVVIAGAAAVVAGQRLAQGLVRELAVRVAIQEVARAHHHARRAIAALHGVALDEGLLHGGQFVAVGEAFGGEHLRAFGLHRQHQTGLHRRAVHLHRTRAAGAFLAAKTRTIDAGVPAQEIRQQGACFNPRGNGLAVDGDRNIKGLLSHGCGSRSGR